MEYLSLRYLRVNGVYDVPLLMAHDLIEFGCAEHARESAPLSDFDAGESDDD